jgi:Cys-rich repeat protein
MPGRRARQTTGSLTAMVAVAALGGCGVGTDTADDVVTTGAAALPAGWTGRDIGVVPTGQPAGSSDAVLGGNPPDTSVFTLTSSASGIARQHNNFNQGDNVHFVSRTYTLPAAPGDFEVKVRLTSLSGSINGQAGLMIRQSEAAGAFNVTTYLRKNEVERDAPEIPDIHELGHAYRYRWAPGTPDLDPSASMSTAIRLDPGPDPDGAQDPPASFYRPIWFRIQRSGNDYAVARSANGVDWVPFHNASGGQFPLTGMVQVGMWVAAGSPTPLTAATAVFDSFSISTAPRAHRTSWIGASYDQVSTGHVPQSLSSFFVAPDGSRVYKYYPIVEEGSVIRIFNGSDGRVQPFATSLLGQVFLGDGVDQGALTGDGTSLYFARKQRTPDGKAFTGHYCIDRMNADLTPLPAPVSVCGPNATRVGGMAIGRDSTGAAALFVSELGPAGSPPPATGTIRVFRADTLAPATPASFSVSARPGPMAVDNNFNLWVIHTAVDYPSVASYDVAFTPAVKRYNASGTMTGQLTGPLLPQNPVAIAVDRRAGRDRMFIADNGSAQNVRVYRGLAGTPSADTTFNASATFGQSGGIYSATGRGLITGGGTGTNNRFYALSGLAIDSAGSLYVALGAPYVDIRKYNATGTGNALWATYGLMNFSNMIDFDDATDGQDAYSARHHFSLNLASTTPGGEWSGPTGYRSLTWDPFPAAPLAYREKDEHGVTRRRSGVPRIRTIDNKKFLFVGSDPDPDPDGDDFGPRGRKGGILIYRFNGEIAIPWAAIRQEGWCAYSLGQTGQDAKAACGAIGNPNNCACNIDPNNEGSLDAFQVMTVWIDSNGDGVENETEQSTLNPVGMTLTGCEASDTCPLFENGAENVFHPSQAMWNNPPPRGQASFFDVDANGDIWLSYGNDVKAIDVHMPGNPERVMSAAIWQLKRTAGAIAAGQGPRYDLTLNTGRVQHPLPPEMTSVSRARYVGGPTQSMYLMGGDAAGKHVVNRYDNWLSGTKILRSTATIPYPSYANDVNAQNDFMYLWDPPYQRCGVWPWPADTSGCNLPWNTGVQFQWIAFDVAGDKTFVAEQWGPIHVFEGSTGLPVTTIFAGPEESGFQSWDDSAMGIRAFKRANGEYLIASTESSGHARTFLFRWTPPAVVGCAADAQCAAGQFCDAGTCRTRPCNLSDPFASMAPVFPAPVTADGFTLSANRLTAFASRNELGHYDIYTATRMSPTAAFGALTSVGMPINSPTDERAPWLSEDGLRMYFSRTNTTDGSADMFVATRTGVGSPWTVGEVLGANVPNWSDEDPFLMPGEQTIYFQSARSGTSRDIYVATKSGSTFTNVVSVGGVNSDQEDTRPMLTRDGLTMFLGSRRPSPLGDTDGDIWVAQRSTPTGTFMTPTNVASLNTSGVDFPVSLSADGCTLTFASNRETGLSGTQVFKLYQATRAAALSTVTVTMNIVGNGTVTEAPFNCGPGTPGTCTAQRPFGTTLRINASRQATWSGACEASGTPGLSTDGNVSFTLGGVCTVTFPD